MGAALTPREVIAALDHWHVPYSEVPGWEKRNNGTQWGDVAGCMFHHTAGDGTDARERDVITFGHSSLPGPLAQFGPRDDGKLDVIAAGPANHAGGGDPDVLAAVRAESYGDYPPKTNEYHGSPGSVIGNRMFYGWETYYAGPGDPTINPKQYRVAILSMAAITWAMDRKDGDAATWTSKSTIGHKEWSSHKPDPAGVDMKDARADIQWCLDNGPDAARRWYDTGEKGDDIMAVLSLDEAVQKIRNAVLFDGVIGIIGRDEKMSLATAARVIYDRVKGHDAQLAALEQGQKDLASAVAAIDSGVVLDLPSKEEYLAVAREEFKAKADKARVSFEDEAAPAPEVGA